MCISRTTTSKTAASSKPSAHLRQLELRVNPIIRIKPAGSLYGGHAMAKAFLEMLAEVPQIKKRTFWRLQNSRKSKRERFGVCGSSANRKKNVLAFAELPQIEKRTFWRLRKFRKSKRERFGVCGSSANQKENALALAEVPQIKKKTLWRLRDSRKSRKERFGPCGSSANQKKNVLALAEVPQAFPKTLWSLQRSIQAILQGLGVSFFRSSSRCKDFWKGRSAVEGICFVPDRSLGGHTLLRSISEVPI